MSIDKERWLALGVLVFVTILARAWWMLLGIALILWDWGKDNRQR